MNDNVYFEQCMDFLARMIEKYGDRIELPSDSGDHLDNEPSDDLKSA